MSKTRFLAGVFVGKCISLLSRLLGFGAGATWSGEVALSIYPNILSYFSKNLTEGIVIVAGTNGKTTTAKMITTLLETNGKAVVHNDSGANLENGAVSAFLKHSSWFGNINASWAVLEVDENSFPPVAEKLKVKSEKLRVIVVLLNLFRDQLDRYGEVDLIAEKWHKALQKLSKEPTVILNADDPQVAYLGKKLKANVSYFGLDKPELYQSKKDHATDSTFCLSCGGRLLYSGMYFSHIGVWKCESCEEERPKPDITNFKSSLPGIYNQYNATATAAIGKALGLTKKEIQKVLYSFTPAFGRQEEFVVSKKTIKIFLSKNPAGFTVSLRAVIDLLKKKPGALLFVLNNQIPDGRDVSWIWDVDFEMLQDAHVPIFVSGERVYDMGLRVKYARETRRDPLTLPLTSSGLAQDDTLDEESISSVSNSKPTACEFVIEPSLKKAIQSGLDSIKDGQTLYVLPTYSAMLQVRKIIGGKKIL